MRGPTLSRPEILFLVAIAGLGTWLLTANLGNSYLWQDEAQTALVSRTVLQYGVPKGYDGKNYFSQELGAEYGEDHIWKWHLWFPFYVVAAGFKILGQSTLTARLPFAIFGLATILLVYFFARSLFRERGGAALSAAALLLSVPFLILSRQCRYYSMTAFFAVVALYGYHRMTRRKRFGSLLYFVGATLLFHTHYIYLATLFAAIAAHLLIFHRRRILKTLAWSLGIVLVNLPWVIWLAGMRYGQQYRLDLFDLRRISGNLWAFLRDIEAHLFPLWILPVPLVAVLWVRFRKSAPRGDSWRSAAEAVSLPLLFIGATLVALAAIAPAPFFRYLAPLVPLVAVTMGYVVSRAGVVQRYAAIPILAVLVALSPIRDFLHEITHDHDGPIEGIVKHLEEHAKPDDVVAITYGDLPLKFYTGLRVVGGLTGEDLSPARNAEWVILRAHVISGKDYRVHRFLVRETDWRRYRKIFLPYPDTPFQNRESPAEHRYRTAEGFPRVVVLRRID